MPKVEKPAPSIRQFEYDFHVAAPHLDGQAATLKSGTCQGTTVYEAAEDAFQQYKDHLELPPANEVVVWRLELRRLAQDDTVPADELVATIRVAAARGNVKLIREIQDIEAAGLARPEVLDEARVALAAANAVDVRSFGAVGDGATDDAEAFEAAADHITSDD